MATTASHRLGRAEFIGLVAAIMASTALGIDLMLPAFGEIRTAFGLPSDSTAVAGIVTAYFIGLATGQIVWGPTADRFGRKPILRAGLTLYAVGALLSAFAPNLTFLYASRLVWGLGSAGPRVVAVAVVRDRFEGDLMARVMSFTMAVFVIVPVIAPSLGAGILAVASWRWVFAFGAIYAGAVMLWGRRLPETLHEEHRSELRLARITNAARQVVSNRQTLAYTLSMTALFGVFSSYLASSELIYGEVFGRAELFPVLFGGTAAAMGLANVFNGVIVPRIGVRRLVHILLIVFLAVGALLVWIAERPGNPPGLWLFLGILGVELLAYAMLFPNMNTIAMDPMGAVAGMAAAVIGLVTIAGGSLLGAVLDRAFDGTVGPLSWGFLIAGTVALAIAFWSDRDRLFPGAVTN